MRVTHALVEIAAVLMAAPSDKHWAYGIVKQTGVRSGVVYPSMTRMLEAGWLTDGWEDPATIDEKRPPRRYYELTDRGKRELGAILRTASTDRRFTALQLGWA